MQFIIGLVLGSTGVLFIPYALFCHSLTGYWPWQRPFCVCEDCWWSGRTRIYEYTPCPRCHRAFMRIAGFNLTQDVLADYELATGRKLPCVVPVPTEDVYRY